MRCDPRRLECLRACDRGSVFVQADYAAAVQDDDRELLTAWQRGDRAAGNAFVDRHFAAVYRFFRRRLRDGAAAKDLAQRTFLACFEAGDRFGPRIGVRVYVLGIARNLMLHHFRDERRPPEIAADAPPSLTPSRAVARAQDRGFVQEALARMPDALRTTLELHYWDELGVDEIAVLLDTPAGTIKWRLHRGRQLLREEHERRAG
jgi:RNA polymerase sigma factor (sigma-70 family)